MKEIGLTNSTLTTKVSDCDYDYLMQWKWKLYKGRHTDYVARVIHVGGKHKVIFIHREIMQTPEGLVTDHINHDGLDNQRENLRVCTTQQNSQNSKSRGVSPYKGVSIKHDKGKEYITACISVGKKKVSLGYFKSEIDAAIAFDDAAIRYRGEFANLNFPNRLKSA